MSKSTKQVASVARDTITTVSGAALPATVLPVGTVVHFRKYHPGGGKLGRCSYGLPGVAGIIVFDLGLFAGGVAPSELTITGVAFAQPTTRKAAGITSAVVAAGNVAVNGQGNPVAAPSTVAATVAAGVKAITPAK